MKTYFWAMTVCLLTLVFGSFSTAQGPDKGIAAQKDEQFVRTRPTKRQNAANIDFHKQLKLDYPSLHNLGSRIETARQNGDPVALSHLASELHVAEKVSGKKASLTSSDLLNESTDLASMRSLNDELQAIAVRAKQVQPSNLDTLLGKISKSEARAKALAKEQQKIFDNALPGKTRVFPVLVENYTDESIAIYENGNFVKRIPPSEKRFVNVVLTRSPMVLVGHSLSLSWGPRNIYGTFDTYRWVLLPPGKDADE